MFYFDYTVELNKMPAHYPKYSFKNLMAQQFSFPKTIMHYCFQRNSKMLLQKSTKYFYKLYSVCKYFFAKIRLIPSHYLLIVQKDDILLRNETESAIISYQQCQELDIHFCPEEGVQTLSTEVDRKIISKMIPRICNNKFYVSVFQNQILNLEEFIFLTRHEEYCTIHFYDCIVTDKAANGPSNIVPVEDLLKACPKINTLRLYIKNANELNYCTSMTAQKLAAMPKFENLSDFIVFNVPEDFDALSYAKFIKKNVNPNKKSQRFWVEFSPDVDDSVIYDFQDIVEPAVAPTKSKGTCLIFL